MLTLYRAKSYVISYCPEKLQFVHLSNIFPGPSGGKGKITVRKQDRSEEVHDNLLKCIEAVKAEGTIKNPIPLN